MNNRLTSISNVISEATFAIFLSVLLSACSFQHYTPKPIDPLANTTKLEGKSTSDKLFNQYLLDIGYSPDQLPLKQWGLEELTYCALYFNPTLDVAREKLRVAESSEAMAAERALPTVISHFAHSNRANGDISPSAFGLSIEIPIESSNKRAIRIENAKHLSVTTQLEIAQTAWQIRNQLAQLLNEFQFNQQQIYLLKEEELRRREILDIYQKRLALGLASNVELSTAKLQQQATAIELSNKQLNKVILLSKLAENLGLPLANVENIHFESDFEIQHATELQTVNLETTALLNRLDIRAALERYAIAETKLKLEISKQYPDIVISPGYAYEFGDKIWSLGISGLFNLLSKNKIAIAEATQLRELEAAEFEALQAKVIAEVNIANFEANQAIQEQISQQELFKQQQNNTVRMERKFAAGDIDRLELTFTKLENITAEKNAVLAHFKLNFALIRLENTLQKHLSNKKNSLSIEDLVLKN